MKASEKELSGGGWRKTSRGWVLGARPWGQGYFSLQPEGRTDAGGLVVEMLAGSSMETGWR